MGTIRWCFCVLENSYILQFIVLSKEVLYLVLLGVFFKLNLVMIPLCTSVHERNRCAENNSHIVLGLLSSTYIINLCKWFNTSFWASEIAGRHGSGFQKRS